MNPLSAEDKTDFLLECITNDFEKEADQIYHLKHFQGIIVACQHPLYDPPQLFPERVMSNNSWFGGLVGIWGGAKGSDECLKPRFGHRFILSNLSSQTGPDLLIPFYSADLETPHKPWWQNLHNLALLDIKRICNTEGPRRWPSNSNVYHLPWEQNIVLLIQNAPLAKKANNKESWINNSNRRKGEKFLAFLLPL